MTKIKQQEVISMANTTPNKETIRRLCLLHGGSYCFLYVDTGYEYVDVLSDIPEESVISCLLELESWCGMKFKLFNEQSPRKKLIQLTTFGEKILPIEIT